MRRDLYVKKSKKHKGDDQLHLRVMTESILERDLVELADIQKVARYMKKTSKTKVLISKKKVTEL